MLKKSKLVFLVFVLFALSACQKNETAPTNTTTTAPLTNFLLGLCNISSTPEGDPPVTSCNIGDLEARPVWASSVIIYNPSSVTFMNIWGGKEKQSGIGGKNQVVELNTSYQVESPSSVIVTSISPNGCSHPEKFTKLDSDIYVEQLSYTNCSEPNQIRALDEIIKQGKRKVSLIQ
ncbi:MAG: hypothetical protein WCK80_04245 [bacterium]